MEKSVVNFDKLIVTNNEATYDLHDEGAMQGTYKGRFKFKCFLTPMETVDIDREIRALVGDNPAFASEDAESLAFALVQLKYRVLSAPPFWNSQTARYAGGDIPDINVINRVFAAAIEAEGRYRDNLKKKKEQAIESLKTALAKREEANKAPDKVIKESQS